MARNVKYTVRLEPEERQQLLDLVTKGTRAAATLTRARILLKADAGPHMKPSSKLWKPACRRCIARGEISWKRV